jgi:hypothetical protein
MPQDTVRVPWVPDTDAPSCMLDSCKTKFSLTTRRHHCRLCGIVACSRCSTQKVACGRVCDTCFINSDQISVPGDDGNPVPEEEEDPAWEQRRAKLLGIPKQKKRKGTKKGKKRLKRGNNLCQHSPCHFSRSHSLLLSVSRWVNNSDASCCMHGGCQRRFTLLTRRLVHACLSALPRGSQRCLCAAGTIAGNAVLFSANDARTGRYTLRPVTGMFACAMIARPRLLAKKRTMATGSPTSLTTLLTMELGRHDAKVLGIQNSYAVYCNLTCTLVRLLQSL